MLRDYSEQNREHSEKIIRELQRRNCRPEVNGLQASAYCPFHEDDKPSFSLKVDDGCWFCHACQCGGTIWQFQARLNGTDSTTYLRLREARSNAQKREDKRKNQKNARLLKAFEAIEPLPVEVSLVYECHQKITDYFHNHLLENAELLRLVTEEHNTSFEYVWNNWRTGKDLIVPFSYESPRFTLDTIKKFKIGFVPYSAVPLTKVLKNQYPYEVLIGTGLLRKHGNNGLAFTYHNRIIYPYFDHGRSCYSIARITELTRSGLPHKYLKQRTRSQKYKLPLENPPLFNADAVAGQSGVILLTEGITDAIKACEIGITAVSPVTTRFTNRHLAVIADRLRGKQVLICNDSEESGSGELGAKAMELALKAKGVDVRCVPLPRKDEQSKVDVCSFINDEGAEEFYKLIDWRPERASSVDLAEAARQIFGIQE